MQQAAQAVQRQHLLEGRDHQQLGQSGPAVFFALRPVHEAGLYVAVDHPGSQFAGDAALGEQQQLVHVQAEIGQGIPGGERGKNRHGRHLSKYSEE